MSERYPGSDVGAAGPEPDARATVAAFRREMRFARALTGKTTVTWTVLALIVGVFVLLTILAGSLSQRVGMTGVSYGELAVMWANGPRSLEPTQLWRLVMYTFVHGDILHLSLNGYGLYVLGSLLERLYGPRRFFFVYALSGLTGGLASTLVSDAPSVGASGALFGLLGAAIVVGFRYRSVLPPRVSSMMTRGLIGLVLFNVLLGFGINAFATGVRLDNAAHLGGLAGGALLALFLGTTLGARPSPRALVVERLVLTTALAGVVYSAVCGVYYAAGCTQSRDALASCIADVAPVGVLAPDDSGAKE